MMSWSRSGLGYRIIGYKYHKLYVITQPTTLKNDVFPGPTNKIQKPSPSQSNNSRKTIILKMSFARLALRPAAFASRGFATSAVAAKHTLPDLPYDYAALEPAISGKIMEVCSSTLNCAN
jgi:hypothetical protein